MRRWLAKGPCTKSWSKSSAKVVGDWGSVRLVVVLFFRGQSTQVGQQVGRLLRCQRTQQLIGHQ
jgi:hypothetical protein